VAVIDINEFAMNISCLAQISGTNAIFAGIKNLPATNETNIKKYIGIKELNFEKNSGINKMITPLNRSLTYIVFRLSQRSMYTPEIGETRNTGIMDKLITNASWDEEVDTLDTKPINAI